LFGERDEHLGGVDVFPDGHELVSAAQLAPQAGM
jgi:hypothetical protein